MSYNPFTLAGKTILVTGASSGIGKETAIVCSKLGAKPCEPECDTQCDYSERDADYGNWRCCAVVRRILDFGHRP